LFQLVVLFVQRLPPKTLKKTMTTIDVQAGRLSQEQLSENFSDSHPPLSSGNAIVEANRCYFCYDAPCIDA